MKKEQPVFSKSRIENEKDRPVRLNKFLSEAGVCSRREADRLIEAKRVQIEGRTACLGEQVFPGQHVFLDGKEIVKEEELLLFALHKPAGIECTTDRSNPDNVIDYIGYEKRIFPIGRLDKNSTGLLLLTNAGELSDKILRSSHYHEKEYEVKVDKPLTNAFLSQMQNGVTIYIDNEDRTVTTRKCRVRKTGSHSFSIVLTQGFNRQIRRMCKALGYEVTSLKRIRIMNILLAQLPEGEIRSVTEEELSILLKQL